MKICSPAGANRRRSTATLGFALLAMSMLAAINLSVLAPAVAEDFYIPLEVTQPNFIGFGVGAYPDYFGSDDESVGVAPLGRLGLGGERYVQLVATDVRFNLIDDRNWRLGPAAFYRFGRDSSIDDPVVRQVHEVDRSLDLGLSGGYTWRDPADDRKRVGFSVWTLADVTGGHDGWTTGANVFGMYPVALPVTIAAGAGVTYADGNYMDTYFGVTPADSQASGLAPFSAGAGVRDARGWLVGMLHLSPRWHLGAGVLYSRLLGDAKDSPIVSERGSANQWVYGVGSMYAW